MGNGYTNLSGISFSKFIYFYIKLVFQTLPEMDRISTMNVGYPISSTYKSGAGLQGQFDKRKTENLNILAPQCFDRITRDRITKKTRVRFTLRVSSILILGDVSLRTYYS